MVLQVELVQAQPWLLAAACAGPAEGAKPLLHSWERSSRIAEPVPPDRGTLGEVVAQDE